MQDLPVKEGVFQQCRRIHLGDVEINYRIDDFTDPWIGGKGIPIVLMHHGFSRNLKFLTPWVPTLARKCKVLRYDARGFGDSSIPPEGSVVSAQMLCDDALALIDKLGIDSVHWVGTMAGGIVGLMFARLHPERIKSLTLCNSPCKLGADHTATVSLGESDPFVAIEKLGVREWKARSVHSSLDMSKADPRLAEWSINEMGKTPKHIAVSIIKEFHSADESGRLAEIKVPTLIIAGERSIIVPPEMQRFMQEQIPNSRLCVLHGISDGIEMIMPDRCAEETLSFITEVN